MYFDSVGVIRSIVHFGAPFKNPVAMCQTRGDTLIVQDTNGGTIGVVDGSGRIVKNLPAVGGSYNFGCASNGTFVTTSEQSLDRTNSRYMQFRMAIENSDGSTVRDLGWFAGPSAANPVISILPYGDGVYIADGSTTDIRYYSAAGNLTRIVRLGEPLVRFTASDYANGIGICGGSFNRTSGEVKYSGETGPFVPLFRTVMLDATGRLWMSDSDCSGLRWTAFGPDGKVLGRLIIPAPSDGATWRVREFGAREVQIVAYDSKLRRSSVAFFPLNSVQRP